MSSLLIRFVKLSNGKHLSVDGFYYKGYYDLIESF
jgi:hypothetical protein